LNGDGFRLHGRGGARPGSGPKPGPLTQAFRDYFGPHFPELLERLLHLALGHKREGGDGKLYAVGPDRATITYIIDRLLGKPKVEDGGDLSDLQELLEELRRGKPSAT
jgi:hypothetical protein